MSKLFQTSRNYGARVREKEIMRFEEVLPALRDGKKITDTVSVLQMIYYEEIDCHCVVEIINGEPKYAYEITDDAFMHDDWQIVE